MDYVGFETDGFGFKVRVLCYRVFLDWCILLGFEWPD